MDRPKGILKETHPTTNGPPTFSSTYVVLPLSLPPQRAFPRPATHYLYLRRDAPPQTSPANAPRHDDDDEDALGKTEDEDGVTRRRSLFAANVPVDASEAALRALFARLDPAARVERVEFEGERRPPSASALDHGRGGKKRRRPHDEEEEEEDGDEGGLDLLPSTWSFRAKKPGGAAVLVFVDAAAAAAGLRAAKRRARAGSGTPAVEWRGTDDETGVRREFSPPPQPFFRYPI
jgi:ribosomal RNA-processing protein 7